MVIATALWQQERERERERKDRISPTATRRIGLASTPPTRRVVDAKALARWRGMSEQIVQAARRRAATPRRGDVLPAQPNRPRVDALGRIEGA